jgi:integrase/recombinase XerD
MIKIIKNGVVVSVLLDTRTINKEGTYPVKIKVYYQGKPKYYSVGLCLTSKEELEEALEGKSKECREIQEEIGKELSRILKNVEYLAERGTFSFDRLNTRLGKNIGGTINEMLEAKIKELGENNKFGSKTFYQSTLSLIKRYKKNDVPIRDITAEWLRNFEKFCLKTVNQTTLAINMRNIRAIMNIAKSAGMIREADYPFGRGKYQIKEGLGRKKALNKKQLKAIANYSDGNEFTEFYRDLWLFIYFCNGINVADLINLKFSDIQNGEISFIRQKTKDRTRDSKRIYAPITPEMQSIIDKWGNNPRKSIYIFPFMKTGDDAWEHEKKKKNLTKHINDRMKVIGEKLNIGKITTYVARHTYATVLRNEGVPVAIISPMLGHTSITTTEIYLADLESENRARNAHLLSF